MKKFNLILGITLMLSISSGSVMAGEIKAILIGSHGAGINQLTMQESFAIENYLQFNGINYTFFDINVNNLSQSVLDRYKAVILEGNSIRLYASEDEKNIISENMKAGNITVFYSCVKGTHKDLNDNIYSALNISVTGMSNSKDNIKLNSAKEIFNYRGEENFIFTGGTNQQHLGLAINCYTYWDYFGWRNDYVDERRYGLERVFEKWMKNAFGVDARVTMPLISLAMDDVEFADLGNPRNQSLLDWIDENKNRIRNSGYLTTYQSGYATGNKTFQSDEEILSRWGSISLHGYNHRPAVGANFSEQNIKSSMAINTLKNFSRYKPILSPDFKWNNDTLHVMYVNKVYYLVSSFASYRDLFKANFDANNNLERKKIEGRFYSLLKFYPLINDNGTDIIKIYAIDRCGALDADVAYDMTVYMKATCGLDRWAPSIPATHYAPQALKNVTNWITQMNDLMELVDHDSYQWRRWVDNYDLARNIRLFETDFKINSIIVDGSLVTYNLSADDEIRYLTLKASKDGHAVKSVKIDGSKYNYFGKNYVHLPAINGTTIIEVALTENEDTEPHVYHIQPSAVIEDTTYSDGLLNLSLSGEFVVNIYLDKTSSPFLNGKNTVTSDGRVVFQVNASNSTFAQQINLAVVPSSENVTVEISEWTSVNKKWVEGSNDRSVTTDHLIGDFNPNSRIEISVDGRPWNTYKSDANGFISFTYAGGYSSVQFEAVRSPSKVPYTAAIAILFLIISTVFWIKMKRR